MNNDYNDLLLHMLQEKLEWYFLEAPIEKFNPDVVISLSETLDMIEPPKLDYGGFGNLLLRYQNFTKMSS